MDLIPQVTHFLDQLDHPLRKEIELLRAVLLTVDEAIGENTKWIRPNYTFAGEDRIAVKIPPSQMIQLFFHRGVKKQVQLKKRLIQDPFGLLDKNENHRAIPGFRRQKRFPLAGSNLPS